MAGQRRRDLLELVGPLYRSLRRIEEQCASTAQLSMWQYAILSIASSHEGLSQTVIADRLGYSKNRIVGDLDVLAARGLAERRPGYDRRAHAIHVTPDGLALVDELHRAIWAHEEQLLSHMSEQRRAALLELLSVAVAPNRPLPPKVHADAVSAAETPVV